MHQILLVLEIEYLTTLKYTKWNRIIVNYMKVHQIVIQWTFVSDTMTLEMVISNELVSFKESNCFAISITFTIPNIFDIAVPYLDV